MPAVFPIAYFGSVSYYKKLVQAGEITFELHEHYVKQTWRNRMTILGPNGIQNLTVPVEKPEGNKTITQNILISNAENWRKNHWKAIESAYSPSPYFDHYEMEIRELINDQLQDLVTFNLNIHRKIVQWLDLPLHESFTTTYILNIPGENDFRNRFNENESEHDFQYVQVFSPEKFVAGLSILDAIFNLGPMARKLIIDK